MTSAMWWEVVQGALLVVLCVFNMVMWHLQTDMNKLQAEINTRRAEAMDKTLALLRAYDARADYILRRVDELRDELRKVKS